MAKKWGRRGKPGGREAGPGGTDPRSMFGFPPAPRGAPPASSTPLADHLSRGWPGVGARYVVLPRTLAESMPLPWQQQLTKLLAQFHDTHGNLSWPAYQVVPSRPERLVDLDEEQLAEVGYLVEIDSEGEMVYRERSGRKVDEPENTTVLVSCMDPIVRTAPASSPRTPGRDGPARMNIGPPPVWRTTPPPASAPDAPPLPPPPTAPMMTTPSVREPSLPGSSAGDETSEPVEEQPNRGRGEFGPTGDEPTEIPYRYRH